MRHLLLSTSWLLFVYHLIDRNRMLFPFYLYLTKRFYFKMLFYEFIGCLTNQNLTGFCVRLQTCGHVYGIANRRVIQAILRADVSNDGISTVDSYSKRDRIAVSLLQFLRQIVGPFF